MDKLALPSYALDSISFVRIGSVRMREGGNPGDERAGIDRLQHRALRADLDAVADAMWPVTPLCPAIITSSSMTVLPAIPTCAASSTRRPIATPCAMCTRLSIFVPARIRVSPIAGRSIVEFAPISTSSSIDDVGVLRDLEMRAVLLPGEAEAVAADHGAVRAG